MLQPIGDRVIVKVKDEEEEKVGGIVLASNAKEKPQMGEIIAVGNGERNANGDLIPMSVAKGETVFFDKYSGTNLKYEGEKYLVLRESDLLAVVK